MVLIQYRVISTSNKDTRWLTYSSNKMPVIMCAVFEVVSDRQRGRETGNLDKCG